MQGARSLRARWIKSLRSTNSWNYDAAQACCSRRFLAEDGNGCAVSYARPKIEDLEPPLIKKAHPLFDRLAWRPLASGAYLGQSRIAETAGIPAQIPC